MVVFQSYTEWKYTEALRQNKIKYANRHLFVIATNGSIKFLRFFVQLNIITSQRIILGQYTNNQIVEIISY